MGIISKKGRKAFLSIKGQKGFTLLEVMVSSAIMAIALMAFGSVESISVVNSRRGQTDTSATAASDEILERMRRNRSDLISYSGFDTANAGTRPSAAGILQNDYDQWKVNVEKESGGCGTVQVAANTPMTDVTQVTVTVLQPPCSGTARAVVVQTLFN